MNRTEHTDTASEADKSAPSLSEIRLLPLTENAANEKLANALARLLVDDEKQAQLGAQAALLILTGIQTFLDNEGNYGLVEQLWEPNIVARQLEAKHGHEAWKMAGAMADEFFKGNNQPKAAIYNRAAAMLADGVKKNVDLRQ